LVHANFINVSYRKRGREPRIKIIIIIIKPLIAIPNKLLMLIPRTQCTLTQESTKIDKYSAKKIKTNPPEEYSILNPETNSDSPSAVSKGLRFDSAKIVTTHKIR